MARQLVGTSVVVPLPVEDCIIAVRNLGPGTIYFDTRSDVTTGTGMKLGVGEAYDTPISLTGAGGRLWMISDQENTDVRYVVVG